MDVALLLARVLLAGIFGLAAVSNLVDLPGSAQSMHNIGLPRRLAIVAGIALPVVELAIALALIPRAWAWWGALGAAALLLLFIVGVAANLARGRAPDIRCPGQLRSAPTGWPGLARTGALAAVAAFILWQGRDDPGLSMVAWAEGLSAVEAVALAVGLLALALAAVVGWLTMQLLRQNGRLLVRIDVLERARPSQGHIEGTAESRPETPVAGVPVGAGVSASSRVASQPAPRRPAIPNGNGAAPLRSTMRVGQPAPNVTLSGIAGETVALRDFRGERALALFWNPACGFCIRMLDDLRAWDANPPPGAPRLVMISTGTVEANRKMGLRAPVLLDQGFVAGRAFGAAGTPSAVLIDAEGVIASEVAIGAQAVLALAGADAMHAGTAARGA